MNKLEQLHLDAIENNIELNSLGYLAKILAEITEQIAIEFTRWLLEQEIVSINSDKKYLIPSYKDLFQEFLKTKQ